MGFKEFFRFSKGKLIFIGVIFLLLSLFLASGYFRFSFESPKLSLFRYLIAYGLMLSFVIMLPFTIYSNFSPNEYKCAMACIPLNALGWIELVIVTFIFWYFIACVFSWIWGKIKSGKRETL